MSVIKTYTTDKIDAKLNGKASTSHNHKITELEGCYERDEYFEELINGKADTGHTHPISQITNLQKTLDSKASISARDFIVSIMGSDSPSSNVWYQFFEMTTSGWGNYNFLLYVSCGYRHKEAGILKVSIRSDNPTASLWDFSWLVRESETNVNNFLAHVEGNKVKLYCYNTPSQYGRTFIKVLSANDINGTPLSDSNVRTYFLNGVPIKLTAKPTFTHTSTDISHSIASVTGLQDALNSKSNSSHTHNSILDKYDSRVTTFAYSQSELPYESFTWLAGWNGSELRAVNKDLFATTSHKHTISDVTGLEDQINYVKNEIAANDTSLVDVWRRATDVTKIEAREDYSYIDFFSLSDNVNFKTVYFKKINGQSVIGNGDITVSASVPTASQSTAGIYKVMTYSPVNTSNWYADDIVLSGKALKYISEQLKWGSSSSSSYPTKTGYLGAYSTADADKHKQIKLADLTGGTKGRFYYIWGTEKCEYGILSVQQKTTFYRDYDCLAMSSNDHGYWSASELFVSIYIPPNTTYYLWGTNIKNVYARWFE